MKNYIYIPLVFFSSCLFGQNIVNVSGNVSGNWTNNNIYIAQQSITIPVGATLTIQAGTTIKFNLNDTFNVYGTLNAVGTDSSKILFTSNSTNPQMGDWLGIGFTAYNYYHSNIKPIVTIKNCIIEYCGDGIDLEPNNYLDAENNEVRYFNGVGIYVCGGNAFIEGNDVHDFNSQSYNSWGVGIWADNCSPITGTISCNNIYNGEAYGIIVYSNVEVVNNTVYNIANNPNRVGKGIEVSAFAKNQIHDNFIYECYTAIDVNTVDSIIPNIHNNTLLNNRFTGLAFGDFSNYPCTANGNITNNIIVNNNLGIYQYTCSTCQTTPNKITNNLFWNNSAGNFKQVQISGLGAISITNVNNTPADIYYNIFTNPSFINSTTYLVNTNSPCINAGNNIYSKNIGIDTGYVCLPVLPPIISIDSSVSIIAPNIFSPNNDGINDFWICHIDNPSSLNSFNAVIYNRWGIKVFETNTIRNGWNGKGISDYYITDGTYYYIITYTDLYKKQYTSKGFIELIR